MRAKQIAEDPRTLVVILDTGDEILSSLKYVAQTEHLAGSSFKAIGALSDVELGWFNWETKKYQTAVKLQEQVELLSLIGDIALKDGEPQVHAHLVIGRRDGTAHGGQLLVKEKALTRSRDALGAERRRMPWLAVDKKYEFDGPKGKVSLLDLFEGRRQLIVYRAFFEPGVFGWPEHACRGCSLGADQVAHLAHLNARDITLAYASRAPQVDIARLKARMGWEMPWYTITDGFDADFGVDEWHGHNVFFRDGERVFRTYFINNGGDEAMGTTWSYLDITPLGRQETWEDSPEGYPQTPPYKWWNWHDNYDAETAPDPRWIDIITDPQEAASRRRDAESKACTCS